MKSAQLIFLVILAVALALFIRGRMRVDLVSMLVLLALAITGILELPQVMAGFGSEPAIIVAAAFVISAGLAATGVTDRIGRAIGARGRCQRMACDRGRDAGGRGAGGLLPSPDDHRDDAADPDAPRAQAEAGRRRAC